MLANGAWGFASTDRLTREGVSACAAQAVSIAKASALAKRSDVVMVPEDAYVDSWQSPFRKDPFEIPLETQLDLLLAVDAEMRRVKGVTLTETDLQFRKIDSWFASSIGSRIHQRKLISGCGIGATSFRNDEIQKRSYPNSFGGQHSLQGYELVESLDLLQHAPRVAEEAVALHSAEQCPQKSGTLILGGSQLGLQIHESVGHPIELDRVLGQEANFAGTSFLTLDQLNKLRYGSDIVNVVADARVDHGPGLGTFAYDDEGVPAQCTDIIKDGQFRGYLSNRETAHLIGLKRSSGHDAHRKLEPSADHSHDQHQPFARYVDIRRPHCRHGRRHPDGNQSLVVHRRPPLPVSVLHRNGLGNQRRRRRRAC